MTATAAMRPHPYARVDRGGRAAATQRQCEAADGSGTSRIGRWELADARAPPHGAEDTIQEQRRGGFRAAMVSSSKDDREYLVMRKGAGVCP